MREMSTITRPDNLLIALVFDARTKMHVNTIVGHYSEFLPEVNLLDKQQKNQVYLETNGFIMVLLNNCVSRKPDFKKVFDYCFLQVGLRIDLVTVFKELDHILSSYTFVDGYGKIGHPVVASIKQDAIKIRYGLNKRREEFDLNSVSIQNNGIPMEIGAYLRSVAR